MHDKAELEGIFMPVLSRCGLELIRFTASGSPRQPAFMVYVDRVGGVTVGECVEAAKALRQALTLHFGPGRAFSVAASSPGTDRLLRAQKDFALVAGRSVVLRVRGPNGDPEFEIVGPVLRADQEGVVLGVGENGTEHCVPYDRIATAKLKLPYSG
ncbi:MAG: hypothetical protein MUE60_06790 [Candidatus Eisenbacteria bacterium]|jgi:ribosome maturation factor RimP|nr:hypothetical protein [Candidatus Eisenbacteria bacterium]